MPMTLNKRFILTLLGLTVVGGVALVAVHWFQSGRIAQALLYQADAAQAANASDNELKYLRRYLEFKPTDTKNLARLADLTLSQAKDQRDWTRANFLYEKLLRLDPAHTAGRRQLVQVCLRIGRYSDALAHVRELPADASTLELTGLCHYYQNKWDDAQSAFEKVVEQAPQQVTAYFYLLDVLRRKNAPADTVQTLLTQLTQRNPHSAEAWLVTVRCLRELNRTEGLDTALTNVLRYDPENLDALLTLAERAQNAGQAPTARECLAAAMDLYPKDVRGYRASAWLELWLNDRPKALATLERGLAAIPGEVDLIVTYADMLAEDGRFDKVEAAIKELQKLQNRSGAIEYLTARLNMQRHEWSAALAQLMTLRGVAVNRPDLIVQVESLLADCYTHTGDRDAAIACLQKALAVDGSSASVRSKLATAYARVGQADEAIRELRQLVKTPNAPTETKLHLAQLLVEQRRNGVGTPEGMTEIRTLLASAKGGRQWQTDVALAEAELLLTQHQHAAALKLLDAAAGTAPKDARLWLGRITVAEMQSGRRAALAVADTALKTCGERPELRLKRLTLQLGDTSFDRTTFQAELDGLKYKPDELASLLSALAEAAGRTGDYDLARALFQRVLVVAPKHVDAIKALAEIALVRADAGGFQTALTQAEQMGAVGADVARWLSVRQLITQASRDASTRPAAKAACDKFMAEQPRNYLAFQCAGRLAEVAGEPQQAALRYKQALDLNGQDAVSFERLVVLLIAAKQTTQAEQLIARLAQKACLPPDRFKAAVEALAPHLSDVTFAKFGRLAVPDESQSVRDRLWLANLWWQRGKQDEALREYQRLAVDMPQAAEARAAYVLALAKAGQIQPARAELEKIKPLLVAPAQRVWLAECYEAVQLNEDAARERLQLLKDTPNDPGARRLAVQALLAAQQENAAKQQLAEWVQAAAPGSPDLFWAKRSLALILAKDATPTALPQALELLQQNLKANPNPADDLRAQAMVLTTSRVGTPAERMARHRQAVPVWEQLVQLPAATNRDRLELAKLYAQQRKHDQSRPLLEKILKEEPGNRGAAVALINQVLLQGDTEQARKYVEPLVPAAGTEFVTTKTLAKFYFLVGELDRVASCLDRYAGLLKQDPTRATKLDDLAGVYEEYARAAQGRVQPRQNRFALQALALLPPTAELAPRRANLFVLNGDWPNALTTLEQAKDKLGPVGLAVAGVPLLHTPGATPAEVTKIKGWMEAAVAAEPKKVLVLLAQADFHATQRADDAAEAAYRAVLAIDGNNVLALNNLAWLLAQRGTKLPDAAASIEKALALAPSNGALLDTRAKVRMASKQFEQAVGDLEASLSEAQTADRYFNLAVAMHRQAKRTAAVAAFKKAQQLGLSAQHLHPTDQAEYEELRKLMN
jgi:tetratricopeptide (TPR) repeat protein